MFWYTPFLPIVAVALQKVWKDGIGALFETDKEPETKKVFDLLERNKLQDFEKELNSENTEEQNAILKKLFLEAIDNEVRAQYTIGTCYKYGEGVKKNLKKAKEWFEKASSQNYGEALTSLGLLYMNGEGVERDIVRAIRFWNIAATNGNPTAQYNIGQAYANGTGVPKNEQEAFSWYIKAANQDYTDAQYAIGVCLHEGIGCDVDYEESVKWFKKASLYNLFVCYEKGIGVVVNHSQAISYLQESAKQGNSRAIAKLLEFKLKE